jgi:D-glycero-alpha-D-manno-heptose-7-phosphate kinase
MLFYTGVQRTAHEIVEEQLARTRAGEINEELAGLKALVTQGVDVLTNSRDLVQFGALLHEGWVLKRRCSGQISNPKIDELYQRARAAGALGGKLLGAGGGGFLLLFVELEDQSRVRQALSGLREVSFRFDNSGITILFTALDHALGGRG